MSSQIDKAVKLLKLLAHPTRLSILCTLIHQGEMSVSQIIEAENGTASQSQISQFLGKMRAEGLVTFRKDKQSVIYTIASEEAKEVVETLYNLYCKAEEEE